jgi:hypothetical protein
MKHFIFLLDGFRNPADDMFRNKPYHLGGKAALFDFSVSRQGRCIFGHEQKFSRLRKSSGW